MGRLLVIAIALAIGCRDKGIVQLESIRDDICKCKTSQCGEAAMKRVPEAKAKANPASQKIARAMMDCMAKLYEAERPVAGPDEAATEGDAP